MSQRLTAQFAFLEEVDRLKTVNRANLLLDGSREENSAEHSWHLALYALILAPFAKPGVNTLRAARMLLLHDLVEIDVGDHPIHLNVDWEAVAKAEQAAAERLFGLLPPDQGNAFLQLWREFEADQTPDARFAKLLDRCQPIFQTLCADTPRPDHVEIVKGNLRNGRAANLREELPEAAAYAMELLGHPSDLNRDSLSVRMDFLNECDKLKGVLRASRLSDDSRRENSGEHSWHVCLFALILAEHAGPNVDIDRVLQMLLIHDIVEVDAGDNPIHGAVNTAEVEACERAAADRLFGLLPTAQGIGLHQLWEEFEAAQSPDARFAKAIDRVQVPILNLANGGGTWVDYQVTLPQLVQRVGQPITLGAPAVWDWLFDRLEAHFQPVSNI